MAQDAEGEDLKAETTFEDALFASPDLREACFPPWGLSCGDADRCHAPGPAGTMRLVSKSVGQASLKTIEHCRLRFGEDGLQQLGPVQIDRMVQLLQHSNITQLSISLHIPTPQRFSSTDHAGG